MLRIVLIFLFLPVTICWAQSSIRGRITTADQQPAPYVTVQLQPANKVTLAGNDGTYQLTDIPAGEYTLQVSAVGIQAQTQSIIVQTGQALQVDFVIKETGQQLQEVTVTALSTNKFVHTESEQVAKMPLTTVENPQVYSVLSKALVQDQVALSNRDVINNAAGVVAYNTPTGTVSAWIRGFDTRNAIRNGMVTQYRAESDPINIERIEVIKGPSGTLYGPSAVSFGGLINKVTKTPNAASLTELTLNMGSYGLMRLTTDINVPVNRDKTALFRLNGAYHAEDGFQTIGRYRNITVDPSFLYTVSNRLTIWVDAEFAAITRTQQPYPSFSPKTTFSSFRELPISYTKYIGGDDVDSKTTVANLFAKAIYKLSDRWTSSTNLNTSNGYVDYSNQLYPRWLTDSTLSRNVGLYSARTLSFFQVQQNINGDFHLGRLRNRIVLGADMTVTRTRLKYAYTPYDTINVNHDFAPITALRVNALLAAKSSGLYRNTQTSYSVYVSDVLNITDRLLVMASLRVDRFENQASIEYNSSVNDRYGQTAYSPKFGVVYQLIKNQVSLFGNYMNGFLNQGPVDQPNGGQLILKPKQANQWEGGVKVDGLNKRLGFTASVYQIEVTNATYTDNNNYTLQGGRQRSQGVELELNAQPIRQLYILAGYGHNDNRFVAGDAELVGRRVQGAPEQVANLWVSYKVERGWLKYVGVGLGGNHVGQAYWNTANTFTLPAYTVLNGVVHYSPAQWSFSVKLNNITNQQYWNSDAQPQMLRQVIGTLSFRF